MVHHPTKADSRSLRGHGSLKGAADVVLRIDVIEDDATRATTPSHLWRRRIVIEKARDGETGPLFEYNLEQVVLGINDDGEPITSCVINEIDGEQPSKTKPLKGQAKRALDVLYDMLSDKPGQAWAKMSLSELGFSDSDNSDKFKVVRIDDWRKRCFEAGLSVSDDDDTERRAFDRAFRHLENKRQIARTRKYVWLWQAAPE